MIEYPVPVMPTPRKTTPKRVSTVKPKDAVQNIAAYRRTIKNCGTFCNDGWTSADYVDLLCMLGHTEEDQRIAGEA